MYFVPSRHGARAALAPEEKQQAAKRQLGNDDPFASIFSDIFGGGNDQPTLTEPTTTAPRTTTVAVVVTPTRTPTPVPVILSTTPIAPTTTPTTTSTTQPFSTARVVTSPPAPIVPTSPSTSSVTLTSTAFNSTNTGATDASQATSSNSGLPSGVIGIIVAASVICGLIFVALIARKIFQSRRRKRRTTWARTSIIAPFEAPSGIKEKALPPPPPPQQNDVQYPAYPPAAMTYAQPIPYSPAAPSSAGYPAPYPFGGTGNTKIGDTNASPNPLNPSSYTSADLAGAYPVVMQQPETALTAAIPSSTLATASGATAATVAVAATVATATATTGGICVVKVSFVPSLPDELSIASGDQVRVLSTYDDGWAMCEKVSSGERGMVPQECLEDIKTSNVNTNMPATQGSVDNAKMSRASSLKRDQGTY